jgi:hypothetical protein
MFNCSAGGIAVAPNGRLWVSWDTGGYGEGKDNVVMLATSGDGGRTWSKPVLIVDPPFRASYSGLWLDPDDRLWFTFTIWPIRSAHEDRVSMQEQFDDIRSYNAFITENQAAGSQFWAITTDNPDDPSPDWNAPRLIAMEYGHMNKPAVLSCGTWVWPTATLGRPKPHRPLFSTNCGRTFHFRGHVPIPEAERNCDENMIVERGDGSLWMLNRTNYGIGESFSFDQGKTWTEMEPSDIEHTVARFFISRLPSGKLLLIKHGKVDEPPKGRERLMAFLSEDDGKTWDGGLMIDERGGVSYPDAAQDADGNIYVVYDYQRHGAKEILMAVFTEEDVATGEAVSDAARFRQVIDKALGHNTRHEKRFSGEARDNDDGARLRREQAGTFAPDDAQVLEFAPGVKLFQDRDYKLAECPEPLRDAGFLQVNMEGRKSLTCARAGVIYVATPLPDRNPRGSRSAELAEQGFEKVALPEFKLFEASSHPANLCTIYQKKCEAGEEIEFGKWAVPVAFSEE